MHIAQTKSGTYRYTYRQRWAVSRYIVSRYVFRYIRVSVKVSINTFDSEYLDTVFRYILAVFKYMYLDTFSDTLKK